MQHEKSINLGTPIERDATTLVDKVAQRIVEHILSGELPAGTKLPPLYELSQQLAVSRTALREAIKVLSAWGAVEVRHGVGTYVTDFPANALTIPFKLQVGEDTEAIHNLQQVRMALEPDIAALAAQNATPQDIKRLEEMIDQMKKTMAEPEQYISTDLAFHSALAQASKNALFLVVIRPIIGLLRDQMLVTSRTPGALKRAHGYHKQICQAVAAGDAESARQTMLSHLNQAWLDSRPDPSEEGDS